MPKLAATAYEGPFSPAKVYWPPKPGTGARVRVLELPRPDLDAAARTCVLELEVDDAGDGVRAVLCRGAVAQNLDLAKGDRRDDGDVRPLGAVRDAVAQPGDDGGAVTALAVDENQGVVRRQAAEVGRSNQGGRVTDRLGADVVGRDDSADPVRQVVVPLADEFRFGNDVDRYGGCGDGTAFRAGADDDNRLFELLRFFGLGLVLGVPLLSQNWTGQTEGQEQNQQVRQARGLDFRFPHGKCSFVRLHVDRAETTTPRAAGTSRNPIRRPQIPFGWRS